MELILLSVVLGLAVFVLLAFKLALGILNFLLLLSVVMLLMVLVATSSLMVGVHVLVM